MFIYNGEMVEHRIQPDIIYLFKDEKRSNKKHGYDNKRFMCGEVEAELEKNIDGSISINKIIKQNEPFSKLYASRTH
jgi:hypothetical protein